MVCFRIIQNADPLLFVGFLESQPFIELVNGDTEAFTESFNGMEPGIVFAKDKKDEEQAAAGIGDDNVRKNGMDMIAASAFYKWYRFQVRD